MKAFSSLERPLTTGGYHSTDRQRQTDGITGSQEQGRDLAGQRTRPGERHRAGRQQTGGQRLTPATPTAAGISSLHCPRAPRPPQQPPLAIFGNQLNRCYFHWSAQGGDGDATHAVLGGHPSVCLPKRAPGELAGHFI